METRYWINYNHRELADLAEALAFSGGQVGQTVLMRAVDSDPYSAVEFSNGNILYIAAEELTFKYMFDESDPKPHRVLKLYALTPKPGYE